MIISYNSEQKSNEWSKAQSLKAPNIFFLTPNECRITNYKVALLIKLRFTELWHRMDDYKVNQTSYKRLKIDCLLITTNLSSQKARQWADLGLRSKNRTLWTWNGAMMTRHFLKVEAIRKCSRLISLWHLLVKC